VVTDRPAAFTLVGHRRNAAWIGGMGTVPEERRSGLGEQALVAAINAAATAHCTEIGLEVLEDNAPAISLYRKLGFRQVRDLAVWSFTLPAGREASVTTDAVAIDEAAEWIARNQLSPQPWQHDRESVNALRDRGVPLSGLAVRRRERWVGAAVIRGGRDAPSIVQIAALDDDAAADIVLTAGRDTGQLRVANVPTDEPASRALGRLGAERQVVQYEMLLKVPCSDGVHRESGGEDG
jgi:hypothetical protein